MRKIPPPVSFPGVMHPIHSGYSQSACVVSVRRPSASIETMECDSDDRTGSSGPLFVEWNLSFDSFVFPCFFISGLDPWSTFFRILTYLFLTVTSAVFFYNRCLLLSCATFSTYHPLSRSVYICRSIARIRLFIITVQACYYLYTSLILSFCCRAVPPDRNSFVSSSVYIGYSICTCCLPNIATRSRHIVTLCRLGQITKHLEGR